jgi:hypothetical protein
MAHTRRLIRVHTPHTRTHTHLLDRYEREAIEKFWTLDKGARRDPLTNTQLASGEQKLFTNWHVRREVTSYLQQQSSDWVPSGWKDRGVPPPQPTTSVSNATEEVRTARERAAARERRQQGRERRGRRAAEAAAIGDRHLQSFLILASLLTVNVVVCVVSRKLTSAGGALIGQPFSPLVHSPSPTPVTPSPTPAMEPASLLPPVCDAFLATAAAATATGAEGEPAEESAKWLLPFPDPSEYNLPAGPMESMESAAAAQGGGGGRGRGRSSSPSPPPSTPSVQYGSDRRLRVSYSQVQSKQYCLSPRRCTMHEDRNPRLTITIAARYVDWTTCVLLGWSMLWIMATTVWTCWSISVYWRWIPDHWRGEGEEELLLLPTASLSVLFTAPFWAIGATMLMQCAVASLAHTELELSPTSWSIHSTMPGLLGGWELERATGDLDEIVSLRAVDTTLWATAMPWPLGGSGGSAAAAAAEAAEATTASSVSGDGSSSGLTGLRTVGEAAALLGSGSAVELSTMPSSPHAQSAGAFHRLHGGPGGGGGGGGGHAYEFSHGLSDAGTADLVKAALTYICRGQAQLADVTTSGDEVDEVYEVVEASGTSIDLDAQQVAAGTSSDADADAGAV